MTEASFEAVNAALAPKVIERDETRWYEISHPVTGERHLLHSVTTIQHRLRAMALEDWKHARIAAELAFDPRLVALAASDPKGAAKEALQRAPMIGTAVHGGTEILDGINGHRRRPAVEMPEAIRDHCLTYEECMTAHGVEIVGGEQMVVNFEHGYAGRFDRFLRLPTLPGLFVGDVKTSAGVYADMALQVSAYGNAEYIVDQVTGVCTPMPAEVRKDVGICIHTTPTATRLVPVEIRAAWEAFKALCFVARVLDGPLVTAVLDELVPGEVPTWQTPPEADLMPVLEASLAIVKASRKRSVTKLPVAALENASASTQPDSQADSQPDLQVVSELVSLPGEARDHTVVDSRRNWLIGRAEQVKARDVEVLRRYWPIGVKTFKQQAEHSAAELDLIQAGIGAAEAALRLPFEAEPPGGTPEPAPLAALEPKPAREPAPVVSTPQPPDEGDESADLLGDVQVLREQVIEANGAKVAQQWAAEANAAGCSLSMNRGTRRRHAIGRILLRVPELGEDVVRALIGHVLDSDQPLFSSTPFGAAVGCLGAAEAEQVAALCISDGVVLGVRHGITVVTHLAPVA